MVSNRTIRALFGLVTITHTTEDRRPDLGEDSGEARALGYKYKNWLVVRVLWTEYTLLYRSRYAGDEMSVRRIWPK